MGWKDAELSAEQMFFCMFVWTRQHGCHLQHVQKGGDSKHTNTLSSTSPHTSGIPQQTRPSGCLGYYRWGLPLIQGELLLLFAHRFHIAVREIRKTTAHSHVTQTKPAVTWQSEHQERKTLMKQDPQSSNSVCCSVHLTVQVENLMTNPENLKSSCHFTVFWLIWLVNSQWRRQGEECGAWKKVQRRHKQSGRGGAWVLTCAEKQT